VFLVVLHGCSQGYGMGSNCLVIGKYRVILVSVGTPRCRGCQLRRQSDSPDSNYLTREDVRNKGWLCREHEPASGKLIFILACDLHLVLSVSKSKIKRSLKLGCVGTSASPVLTTLPGSRMSGAPVGLVFSSMTTFLQMTLSCRNSIRSEVSLNTT
jgi:hypothetical protein